MRPKRATIRNEDSLGLLDRQDRVLEGLFEAWQSDDPRGLDQGQKVTANWRRGTVAKLILEQGALRSAALDDVSRGLRRGHQDQLAEELREHLLAANVCLDRIDECCRGVTPLDLRYSAELRDSIERLRKLWVDDMRRERTALPSVARALGPERHRLRSARYVRAHAPLHPSVRQRWYHRIPGMLRLHALFDLIQSFPDAESSAFADQAVSRGVDQVVPPDV